MQRLLNRSPSPSEPSMPRRVKGRLSLAGLMLGLLFSPAPPTQAAPRQPVVSNLFLPVSQVVFDPDTGERVALNGGLFLATRVIPQDPVIPSDPVRVEARLAGLFVGVGQTSGQRYLGIVIPSEPIIPVDPVIPGDPIFVSFGLILHPPNPAIPSDPARTLLPSGLRFTLDTSGRLIPNTIAVQLGHSTT
jgi:hypothetical protein